MLVAKSSRALSHLIHSSFRKSFLRSVQTRNISSTNRIMASPPTESKNQTNHSIFIYGTAWKKSRTKDLVLQALTAGFRRIDTAAQPKHYQEDLVGEALRDAYAKGIVKREDLYIQTKYTTPAGQDLTNLPYDPSSPLPSQLHTSITSSLHNLRPLESESSSNETYIDTLLLHSPLPTIPQTLQAWEILSSYVPHKIRALGISNTTLPVLQAIYENATVKPAVVQNRFYAATAYDVSLRAFCSANQIEYQSFWTLSGNNHLLKSAVVARLANEADVGIAVALYALVMDLGIVVLNGTTDERHMREDLEGVGKVKAWAGRNEGEWGRCREEFERWLVRSARDAR
ncbi:aldo-keto reductase-like protein [Dendryphion nanum]|uniref:Aldo-keto reductase-like protein n=1 Tax=Dendryphion nanum TaxID=256645 RepID=A0A9P9DFT5_9PLEO|nr:aldo-keto reductase-like protein [Dendryphion nanum]